MKKQEIIGRKDLVRIISSALNNWYLLVFLPVFFFAGSYFYAHRIQEVFAAKCQILLQAQDTYDYQKQLTRGLGLSSNVTGYEYTAGQMRVIKSSSLIEKVLQELQLNVSYYIVGRLKVSEVYKNMPFTVRFDERSRTSLGKVFTIILLDRDHFRLLYDVDGVSKDKIYEFDELLVQDGLYIKVEKSKNLNDFSVEALSDVKYQFIINSTNALLAKYKQNIEISNLNYTSIVEVSIKDEIDERAVAVLDKLSEVYINSTIQGQLKINDNTIVYIDRQLNEIVGILNDIEKELESYKNEKDILNLDREEVTYFDRLVDLEDQARVLKMDLESMDDLTSYLLQNEGVESLLPPSMYVANSDAQISERVRELYALRSEYNSLQEGGTKDNPRLINLSQSIENLKQDLLRYIDVQTSASEAKLGELKKEIDEIEATIRLIPKTQRELLNIQRKLKVNENLYDYLLSRRAETIIAKAGLLPETKLIERPRSVGIVYPNKSQMNRTAALVGLLIAVIIIILKELFFQKITSLGQLQNSTDVSILGSIPQKKNLDGTFRIESANDKSDIIQAFRGLRTNIQYYSSKDACQKIMVTSLMPGEGKTFTSVNLSSIIALAEKKVLLVDFDLHKPRLHKALELDNAIGLSTYLIGLHTIEEVIKDTGVKSLKAITCGPVPPNASELVLRPEVDYLMEYASKNFDYVIIDTPPISLISDGLILMQKCDSKLFVLNSKSTNRGSLDYIEKLVFENKVEGASLILNEEKRTKMSYYYHNYTYGNYGYNYG